MSARGVALTVALVTAILALSESLDVTAQTRVQPTAQVTAKERRAVTTPTTPAPLPATRLSDGPPVIPFIPFAAVALAAILGFGFWLIQREFGKRDKRKAILPRIRNDLAELEKHLSIVRDFPGMQFAPTQALVARLRKNFLEENDIGLILSDRKHTVIASALEISDELATYLGEQDAASMIIHKQEICCCRKALSHGYLCGSHSTG